MSQSITEHKEAPRLSWIGGEDFVKLKGVDTYTATEKSVSQDYIRQNIKLNLPKLQNLKGFMQVKGNENPIALIGGGPSINRPEILNELKDMASRYPTIAAGSSYDWCIRNGIIPTFCTAVDPDIITLNYIRNADQRTIFLIASQCHPGVFERLKDFRVAMWHCLSEQDDKLLEELDPKAICVGGGCTVGLRTINIAIMMGFNNIHLFGYDSCLDENQQDHAYELTEEREMLGLLGQNGKVFNIKMGLDGPGKHTFKCMGYHLAQLDHIQKLYGVYHNLFTPTVHGDSAMSMAIDIIKEDIRRKRESTI